MIEIASWDDWFRLCGDNKNMVEQYENDALKLLGLTISEKEPYYTKHLERLTSSPLSSAFYVKSEKDFWKSAPQFAKNLIVRVWKALAVLFFVFILLGFVLKVGNVRLLEYLSGKWFSVSPSVGTNLLHYGLMDFVVLIVLFLLLWGGQMLFRFLRIKILSSKLKKAEMLLEDAIRWIPPKYRNSPSMDYCAEIYRQEPQVSFTFALDTCNDYLRKRGARRFIKAIMFDLPYEHHEFGNVPFEKVAYDNTSTSSTQPSVTDGTEKKKSNALPPDITSKTFSGSEDAEGDLATLVGLTEVKDQVQRMKNRISFYGSSSGSGGSHMCFLGPPGTGKTTVARIVTKILYDFGYISKNMCVEIDGDYLKSPYVGQTGERTSAIVDYAMGGVLFIDEAYLLYDKQNSLGAEATGVLLKAMEDHRKDFVVILAGYDDKMNRLLASNEGFASRIKYKIYFADFTTDELYQIFTMFLQGYQTTKPYIMQDDAKALLVQQFEEERRSPYFGNARTVRNAVDAIMDYHADRCIANKGSDMNVITKDDVQAYVNQRNSEIQNDTRNYIGASQLDESVIRAADLKSHIKKGAAKPENAMTHFIGLQSVRDELQSMQEQMQFYNGDVTGNGCHMLLKGPHGTGKTSIVRVLTGYLYQMGYIRENRYVSVTGDFLRGLYVGHTGRRTEAVVQYAIGGVLFVDDVALLSSTKADDSFGQEALGVLMQAMEEHKQDLVVIFAGTDADVDFLLRTNTGMRSLVSHIFQFQPYTAQELCRIFNYLAKTGKFTVEKAMFGPMEIYFQREIQNADFGNARAVAQLFEKVKRQHIRNYKGDEAGKYVLTLRDWNDVWKVMQ